MSINTMTMRSNVVWTWRVTTPAGVIYIPDATMGEAIRKAGMAGPESVQPATAEERARMPQEQSGV
jgi:hypothetical protein